MTMLRSRLGPSARPFRVNRRWRPPSGFSLVELVVVLLLLAMLAAMATYSARGVVAKNRLSRGVEVLEQFDRALRRAARYERREVEGAIDRVRGVLTVEDRQEERRFQLPRQVAIESLRMEGNARGLIALGDGSTPSYVVELECDRAKVFVLFAGGSGQVLHLTDAKQVQAILGAR